MRKNFTLIALLFPLFYCTANGQEQNLPQDGPSFYFNSFQNYREKNVDSALFYLRKLADDDRRGSLLEDLLHNTFAYSFIRIRQGKTTRLESSRAILSAILADNDRDLKKAAQPISYWVQVMDNENDDKRLAELVTEFTKTCLSSDDVYSNKTGRYGLLIYQVIAQKQSMQPMADQLLNQLTAKLKKGQVKVGDIETTPRPVLGKRAWYRYLYAYINFIQGNALLADNKIKEAGDYLKTAFDYSPDMSDNNVQSGFYYEMKFLNGKEKFTFQDDYVNYLTKYSEDKQQILAALLTTALVNPMHKDQLKTFYNSNFSDKESFTDYWLKNINQNAKKSTAISLRLIDGSSFSSSKQRDKWVLVDFWGTWCGPCRREHPNVEKFYKDLQASYADKITLLTVACKDTEDKVTNYLAQFHYTFPVAMADQEIERSYNIHSWPSKILISPQGKYIVIPFNTDWVSFVKNYADL